MDVKSDGMQLLYFRVKELPDEKHPRYRKNLHNGRRMLDHWVKQVKITEQAAIEQGLVIA